MPLRDSKSFTEARETVRLRLECLWSEEETDSLINNLLHEHESMLGSIIRSEVPQGYCPCADLINPKGNSNG